MKIYRLERNGIGPFVDYVPRRFTITKKKGRRVRHILSQVKPPANPGDIHMRAVRNKDHVFGTPSKELLKAYFGYNLKDFFSQGFRIHVYEVPEDRVHHMGYEVAFPVEFHRLRTVKKLEEATKKVERRR